MSIEVTRTEIIQVRVGALSDLKFPRIRFHSGSRMYKPQVLPSTVNFHSATLPGWHMVVGFNEQAFGVPSEEAQVIIHSVMNEAYMLLTLDASRIGDEVNSMNAYVVIHEDDLVDLQVNVPVTIDKGEA